MNWQKIPGISGKITEPDHLGDGAYIAIAEYGYVIFTYDGIAATNVVYLEPQVMNALERQLPRLKALVLEKRSKANAEII